MTWLVKFVTTEDPAELVEQLSKDKAVTAVEVVEREDDNADRYGLRPRPRRSS